jgi:hypothetical protein
MAHDSPIERLMDEVRIRGESRMILGDDPTKVTEQQEQAVVEAVREYCERTGRKHAQVARSLGISPTTLSGVLNRNYKGDWQSIVLDLDRWLEAELKRDQAPKPTEFVWTKVAEEIRTVADICSKLCGIGLVYDRYGSGIGKTLALRAIAADTAGAAFVSMQTASASPVGVLRLVGKALRVDVSNTHQASVRAWMEAICKMLGGPGGRDAVVGAAAADRRDPQAVRPPGRRVAARPARPVRRDRVPATVVRHDGPTRLPGAVEGEGAWPGAPGPDQPPDQDLPGPARAGDRRADDGGEPLFSVEEVRKVFAKSKMRLAPDAVRYLTMLAG